ncbi:MAG: DUF6493 family protein [Pseudomonadota bacterium]
MTDTPSAERLTEIVRNETAQACIDYLAGYAFEQRRPVAKHAAQLLKTVDEEHFDHILNKPSAGTGARNATLDQLQIARVAVVATATLAELKRHAWRACPEQHLLVMLVGRMRHPWFDDWAEALLEDNPYLFPSVWALWNEGLCRKPQGPAYTLGLIVCQRDGFWPGLAVPHWRQAGLPGPRPLSKRLRLAPGVLEEDIWRFFEIEGHGEFSLAAFDKYCSEEHSWGVAMAELAADGAIPRDRLIDACMDALERDFAPFRAGWYSRLLTALSLSAEEEAARADRVLTLLGSKVPQTVSLALKSAVRLDKASVAVPERLLEAISPALMARQKGTVKTALRLVESAVARAPHLKAAGLELATGALLSEASEIQAKALDLIERWAPDAGAGALAALDGYRDGIAPSLLARFDAIRGGGAAPAADPEPPAERLPETPLRPAPAEIAPIGSWEELIEAFLPLLEDASDPLAVERLVDGLARHGADRPEGAADRMGPLTKRAWTLATAEGWGSFRAEVAILAAAYTGDVPLDHFTSRPMEVGTLGWLGGRRKQVPTTFRRIFTLRNAAILDLVRRGHRLPMLSAPTDDRGFVAATALMERLAAYRAAGAEPGRLDLALALMRLSPHEREAARDRLEAGNEAGNKAGDEIADALAYALGEARKPGTATWLWIAAAAARRPYTEQPDIAALLKKPAPDAGIRPRYRLRYESHPDFVTKSLQAEPSMAGEPPAEHLACLFHMATAGPFQGSVCGETIPEIRWSARVWPLNLEPFFAQGIAIYEPDQKLSAPPYLAFLEPLLEPHAEMGEMAATLLALYVASADAAVRAMAVEVFIAAVEEDRLPVPLVAGAVQSVMVSGYLPISRWTRAFVELARVSARHADATRRLLTALLAADWPDEGVAREFGGALELLYELQVQAGRPMEDETALARLASVKAGGKLGKFAKKLRALG